uniref:Uncharacterized protein n=1 Tax=Arundo donax TaxID=35708 RepID=A0A0A9CD77_ARUDO
MLSVEMEVPFYETSHQLPNHCSWTGLFS